MRPHRLLIKLCCSALREINEELDEITEEGPWLLGINVLLIVLVAHSYLLL